VSENFCRLRETGYECVGCAVYNNGGLGCTFRKSALGSQCSFVRVDVVELSECKHVMFYHCGSRDAQIEAKLEEV